MPSATSSADERSGWGCWGRIEIRPTAALACCGAVTAALLVSFVSAGQAPLPMASDIADLQRHYETERDAVVKSGAASRFLPELLDTANAVAGRAAAAAKAGRLLQAAEWYRQARWQLPYEGPNFPDHVHRVLGSLRLRHGKEIMDAAFSPDGKWLATASRDATVKVWDMANGHETAAYRGHERYVRFAAFSPDGAWICSAGGDQDIHIWDPATGKQLRTLPGTGKYTTALVVSPDGKYVFAAGDDRTLRIYEAASGEIKRTITDFDKAGSLRSLAFSPDGKRLAGGTEKGQVRLWLYPEVITLTTPEYWAQQDNAASSNFLVFSPDSKLLARGGLDAIKIYDVQQLNGPKVESPRRVLEMTIEMRNKQLVVNRFQCAAWSKDGKTMFTGCTDGVIRLFESETGKPAGTFVGHSGGITGLVMNPQGSQLASASADHTIRLWNFAALNQASEFAGHTGPIWAASFSPDGERIVSCGADKTVRTWDVAGGANLRTFGEQSAALTTTSFSPDGRAILSGGGDHKLRLQAADSDKVLQTFVGHTGTISSAAFNRDGTKIVSGGTDQKVIIWSTETGKPLATCQAGSVVMSVAFTPDGKQVAAATVSGHVRLFDVASGKPGPEWRAHYTAVTGLSFDATGEYLATCAFDGKVKIWKGTPFTNIATLGNDGGPLSAVAFRADGKFVAAAGSDRVVKVWQNDNGTFKEGQIFRGHTDWITAVSFDKSGYHLLSAGADRTIKVWEMASRELPLTAEHTGAVDCVAVSPDGKLLASGATDKTIKIWNAKTGAEVWTIRGHDAAVLALAFTPDGQTLFSSGGDRNIRRWSVADGKELTPVANQQNLTNFIKPVPQLELRPDGKCLIAWIPLDQRGTRVSTFNPATGEVIVEINDRGKDVLAVAWTRDFKRVALGSKNGNIRIYNIADEKLDKMPADFQVFDEVAISSLAFTPDGKTLLAGGDNGEVALVEPTSGMKRKTLQAHDKKVTAIAVSPDGKRWATVGQGKLVTLWDSEATNELRRWTLPGDARDGSGLVTKVTFTLDGRYLVTANANTTLYMLETP